MSKKSSSPLDVDDILGGSTSSIDELVGDDTGNDADVDVDLDEEIELDDAVPQDEVPVGKHPLKCVGFDKGEAKNGNPQYILTYQVLDMKDRKAKMFLSLTAAARWKLTEFLNAHGVGLRFTPRQLLSDEFNLIVGEFKTSKYNGETRIRLEKAYKMNDAGKKRYQEIPG